MAKYPTFKRKSLKRSKKYYKDENKRRTFNTATYVRKTDRDTGRNNQQDS